MKMALKTITVPEGIKVGVRRADGSDYGCKMKLYIINE
jgi:hypothetical protein